MNLRLSILLVSVLVIGTLGWYFVNATQPRTRNPDQPWMYRIDDSVIVHIAVTNDGKRVDYDKKPGSSIWYIQEDPEVPVFDDKWGGTPLLLSGPRVNRVLHSTIDDQSTYGLEPPATIVSVTQRGGQTFEFHLGSTTPDGVNQYARLVGTPTLFTVPAIWGGVIDDLASEPPYPRLYDLEDTPLVYVEVNNDGEAVSYGRRYRDAAFRWFILEGEEETLVPAEQWEGISAFLAYPRAYDVLSQNLEDPASYGLDPPITSAKIGREGGGTIEFYLGDSTPDGNNRYSRVVGDDRLYAIPNDWAEELAALAAGPL